MEATSTKTHHLLGPSSAPRWLQCPGSVIPAPPPSKSGEAAKEGNTAHEVLEGALMGVPPETLIGIEIGPADNRQAVTAEMVSGVNLFLQVLQDLVEELGLDRANLRSEEYLVAHELFGGTCDFMLYEPSNKTLLIMDFKYGRKPVTAQSPQLSCYAVLAMVTMGLSVERVVQVIIQPRSTDGELVSRHEPTLADLGLLYNRVNEIVSLVQQHAATTVTPIELLKIGKHCEYCPKQMDCPAHMEVLTQALNASTQPVPTDEADILTLVRWTEVEDAIAGFFKKVNSTLLSHAEAGRPIPGKKLVTRFGNRQFKLDDKFTEGKLLAWLTKNFGVAQKDLKKTVVLSATQIEKVLKEKGKLDKEAKQKFNEKIVRSVAGVKIVDESARGEAISPASVTAYIQAMKDMETQTDE